MKVYVVIRQAPYALPENEVAWSTLAEAEAYVSMQQKLHRDSGTYYLWEIEELEMPLSGRSADLVTNDG